MTTEVTYVATPPTRSRAEPVLLAIDPGTTQSAWIILAPGQSGALWFPASYGITENAELLRRLRGARADLSSIVIESIASYGMPVGVEVFDTVRWCGRFQEALEYRLRRVAFVPRLEVKQALCRNVRANDSTVRQAVIDRYGGSSAKGTKAMPGPLYGIGKDVWAALAVGLAYLDRPIEDDVLEEVF